MKNHPSLILFILGLVFCGHSVATTPCPYFVDGVCILSPEAKFFGPYENKNCVAINRKGEVLFKGISESVRWTYHKSGERRVNGLLAKNGELIREDSVPPSKKQFKDAEYERFDSEEKRSKRGLRKKASKEITIPATWDSLTYYDAPKRVVVGKYGKGKNLMKDAKYALLDVNGRAISEMKWNNISGFNQESRSAVVATNDSQGFLNIDTGEDISEIKYKQAYRFSEGKAIVLPHEGDAHVINLKGENIFNLPGFIPKSNSSTGYYFQDSFLGYQDEQGWILISSEGEKLTNTKYDRMGGRGLGWGLTQEGLVLVMKDKKYGFIDFSGKEVIPLKWSICGVFSEGLAYVASEKSWGFIDKKGKVVIGPKAFKP